MTSRRALLTVLTTTVAVAAAGCGEDEAPDPPARGLPGAVDVQVRADPDGDGPRPEVRRRIRCGPQDDAARCRALRQAPASTWSPVPDGQVCTRIYGGPQVARVQGRVDGRAVNARLTRVDGCDLARWRTLSAVLDPLVSRPAA